MNTNNIIEKICEEKSMTKVYNNLLPLLPEYILQIFEDTIIAHAKNIPEEKKDLSNTIHNYFIRIKYNNECIPIETKTRQKLKYNEFPNARDCKKHSYYTKIPKVIMNNFYLQNIEEKYEFNYKNIEKIIHRSIYNF